MSRPLFLPTLHQSAWLAAMVLLSIGYALYLRHQVIEQSTVSIACAAGSTSWLCISRRTAILLFTPSAFGMVAVIAALLNLIRPSFLLCAIVVVAGGCGMVLYNVELSSLAVALLILSLARPAPEPD